jgi:hypothetical protein
MAEILDQGQGLQQERLFSHPISDFWASSMVTIDMVPTSPDQSISAIESWR